MQQNLVIATTLVLFLAYFAWLAWAMRHRTRVLQGRWWFFLRAFFPNWKFYHAVGRPPRLHVRGRLASGEWTDWQLAYPRARRHLWHVLHNAPVNLALNHQNLVDHLAADINDLPEGGAIEDCVSYQLVVRLARERLLAQTAGGPAMEAFQFELRLASPRGEAPERMLQSPVLPA
jgi:hypothetical protein